MVGRPATPGTRTSKHGAIETDSALPATEFELKARQLIGEGFCVLEGMLDAGILRHTRDSTGTGTACGGMTRVPTAATLR